MDRRHDGVREEFARRLTALAEMASGGPVADDDRSGSATDAFRWLRNNCPRLTDGDRDALLASADVVGTCKRFGDGRFADEPLSRSVVLQFLANFAVNHETAGRRVLDGYRGTLRSYILSTSDSKLLNNSIMLLYNLCLNNSNYRLDILNDVELIQKIMTHWRENEIEYSKIFLDSIFACSEEFVIVYSNLSDLLKTQLLDLLSIWLDHYQNDVAVEVIIIIKNTFFMDSTIENISGNVVNVLAKASSIEKFSSVIKKHTLFLKKLMDLLINIHECGKNNNNSNDEFKCVKDLSALFVNSDIQSHSRFWFKSDIIRLIANICYNNPEHQNLMRTNNIIPILLECCSFDAKNPLMREWSLFALRNIMEKNMDNQNFVANIDSVGSIDPESSIMLTDTLGMAEIKNSILNNDTMFI